MSKYNFSKDTVTISNIMRAKPAGEKLSMVTCYDSSFARLVDASGIDMVLVGDSLGNVMMGYDDTLSVTVQDIIHHCASVSRALTKPFLIADMPFMSYKVSVEQALENAMKMVQLGHAQAVKVEGGEEIIPQVKALVAAGIPVMGHLGLTPQSIHTMGGYKVQAREVAAKEKLLKDAKKLQEAGAFSLVLELVPSKIAGEVSAALKIPTIGIGAGPDCDGQVLVLQDLLGFDSEFTPKFLKKYADMGNMIKEALSTYNKDVKEKLFPTEEHSFK
jgi:3-methyl-2-oxobutanoate hydroxymethyltransferase